MASPIFTLGDSLIYEAVPSRARCSVKSVALSLLLCLSCGIIWMSGETPTKLSSRFRLSNLKSLKSGPRHGSLGFLPRKRTKKVNGRIRSFPKDDQTKPCHLTAFVAYKAGMTQMVRTLDNREKTEICEAVTILESPPMVCFGFTAYVLTRHGGLKRLTEAHIGDVDKSCLRHFYKNWFYNKEKALSTKFGHSDRSIARKIEMAKQYGHVVRAICHTQPMKVNCLGRKKAHVKEIQVNGGTMDQKMDFISRVLGQQVKAGDVFSRDEKIDVIGVTKGKGWQGVVKRFGVQKLKHNSDEHIRAVGSIGPWKPCGVRWTVPRAGQLGFHHRTEMNKQIYCIGEAGKDDPHSMYDDPGFIHLTPKISLKHYGAITQDWIMLKGSTMGPRPGHVTLRKSLLGPKG